MPAYISLDRWWKCPRGPHKALSLLLQRRQKTSTADEEDEKEWERE